MTTDSLLRFLCLLPLFSLPLAEAQGDTSDNAIPWRPLSLVQNALGATNYIWDGDSLCFSNDQHHVRFYPGRKKADVSGTVVWLNAPADGAVADGSWRLAGVDLDFLQLAVLPQAEGTLKPLRVLLDPGHGGSDDGASSKEPVVKEKDLTLTLAKHIGAQLKKAGLYVDYTRTHDTALSLDDRSRIARKKKADLFISIHANHAENATACGIETYVLPPSGYAGTAEGSRARGWQIGNRNDFHNTMLGFSIHRHLAAMPGTVDRGLKRQSFFVLRETSCPAVLLEFGFLSNQTETRRMLCADWQERSTAAVVAGVLAYAKKAEALDQAVAEKRKQDAEANERWRHYLAAQPAKAKQAVAAPAVPAAAPVLPAPPTRPPPAADALGNTPRDFSDTVASIAASPQTSTNAAPIRLDALIEFYATDKVH